MQSKSVNFHVRQISMLFLCGWWCEHAYIKTQTDIINNNLTTAWVNKIL